MADRALMQHLTDAVKIIVDLSSALREALPALQGQDPEAAKRYENLLDRVRLTVDRGEPYEPEDVTAWADSP